MCDDCYKTTKAEVLNMMEPGRRIEKATVRDAVEEWHIECWFDDGQKYAAISVDIDREDLADWLCRIINQLADAESGE